MGNALDLESRRRIFEFIRSRPGTFLREMERGLDMEMGMLSYHLKVLVDAGMVRTDQEGNHVRYFSSEGVNPTDIKSISYLKNRPTRAILMFVLDKGTIKYYELAPLVGISKSTLTYHIKRLVIAGMIKVSDDQEKSICLSDPDKIMRLLILVREDVERDSADALIEVWNRLTVR
ncbi:MAG: winged helix-turn-helix transcriptional regulator [Methanomassiliicoccales archaeon]